jgi:beta-carotene hydroxylase
MVNSLTGPFVVPKEKAAALKLLIKVPTVAWRSVGALAVVVGGYSLSTWLGLSGAIPLWAACILSGALLTLEFTAVHEAMHRSMSSNIAVNDWMGRIAMLILAPQTALEVFRWYHVRHHRFTNCAGTGDPDRWTHGPTWQLPFRWMTIDFAYLYYFVSGDYKDPIARKLLPKASTHLFVTLAIIAILSARGHGLQVLMLWFLPTRLSFLFMGGVFFWLPHCSSMESYNQQENPTMATSVRLGGEWLLDWVMQYHNYHLIHHLFPGTPCFRHRAIWRLLEEDIRRRGVAIQRGFAIEAYISPSAQELSGQAHA